MIIKWLTGLIKGKRRREKVKVEIEELKKAILEDPKFRDEILRELEYRTGRRDILKAGVLGLLGLSLGVGGSYAYNSSVGNNTVREVVSDYTGVKIPKPCTCIVAQDGTGDYDVSPNEDASEVIQKAIDYAHSKGGGEVRIREGEYLVEKTIKIGPNMRVCGVGQGTKLKGKVTKMIKIRTIPNRTAFFSRIEYLWIEGTGKGVGIQIIDSYGTVIENVNIYNFDVGIYITSESYWSEGTRIRLTNIAGIHKAGLLVEKGTGKGGFQGLSIENSTLHINFDNTKGIALNSGSGGNITFQDVQMWMNANRVSGLYINASCLHIFGNLRIESFNKNPKDVYAVYIDRDAKLWGSFISLFATGPENTFSKIVKDVSTNSGRYIIIKGEKLLTNTGNNWQLILYVTQAKKMLGMGWYQDRNTFEVVTRDDDTGTWNPEQYPLTFKCPVKFEKRMQIPTAPPEVPEKGSMYFDAKNGKIYVYDGSAWRSIVLS